MQKHKYYGLTLRAFVGGERETLRLTERLLATGDREGEIERL